MRSESQGKEKEANSKRNILVLIKKSDNVIRDVSGEMRNHEAILQSYKQGSGSRKRLDR